MDLIGGYLLVILVLFAINGTLLLGNYKFNNVKLILVSSLSAIVAFVFLNASTYLNSSLSFLLDYFGYIFFVIAAVLFLSMLFFVKNEKFKLSIYSVSLTSLISVILFASQSGLDFFEKVLYSLLVFIVVFAFYQISKLLRHAKRQYPIIIGEYMCLFSLLMFIFALTYDSARTLDYSAFSPFLILTPTYQLIYVIIGIIVVLVVGVLINDSKGGNS